MNTGRLRARKFAAQLRDWRAAAGVLPDALVLLDEDGRVRWWNSAAEYLLGLQRNGRRIPFRDEALDAWLHVCSGAGGDVASPADAERRLQLTRVPFGTRRQLLLARDVSRVSKLEQVRRDFVANVSHELRTPLTVIHGYLELLDPQDVPALAHVIDEMRMQSQRMRQIVEDLLELSRLEMQQELPRERVDMAPLLRALGHEAEALSHGQHVIDVEDDAQIDLLGSMRDLHSAFSNLVSNAVRYTPEGGRITIRWRRTPGGAEYSVTDTGYGIPGEHLARLTERFYRVSSSRSRATGGTGLGLSIVKHVLGLHDAELRIESEPGKGSTFTCVFGQGTLLVGESPAV